MKKQEEIRKNIERRYRYVGLTQDDMHDCYIKEAVLNILIKATTTRIVRARKYGYSVATAQKLNGKPVIEIILFCKAEDQYCASCDGYGCPGGC